jgi:integrase
MPRTHRPPSYRLHKARNLAVVHIAGKDHYLGAYGSPQSHEAYARLIAEWRANRGHLLPATAAGPAADRSLTIDGLILAYWRHVEGYYVKDGRPTSEQDNIRQALRFLRRLYGGTSAVDFGPVALKNVRQAMVEAGRSRRLINKDVNRIRQLFGWAVESELLPVQVHQALKRVRGLRKGRSAARETEPVAPVPEASIEAVLPHLSPQVAAMVQLQHLCGARPQEVVAIRPCEELLDAGAAINGALVSRALGEAPRWGHRYWKRFRAEYADRLEGVRKVRWKPPEGRVEDA